jgi:hypothetical protein
MDRPVAHGLLSWVIGMRPWRIAAMVAASVLAAASGWACPLCLTDTGEAVRATIFGPGFWPNVLVAMAPFPVVILLARAAERLIAAAGDRGGRKCR